MIRKKLFLSLIFCSIFTSAQVGINTDQPKATLHIESLEENNIGGKTGILIPRVKNFPDVNPVRLGQLLFLNNNDSLDDGFYYWDGNVWIPFPANIEREIDETIYSFDGQGYTGTNLQRNINFSRFVKANTDDFTLNNNEITIGKNGLYLVSFTSNSKKPSGAEEQANFTYSILVNANTASSVYTSIAGESTASTSAAFSFLKRLNAGDKLKATVTKSNQGPNNYQAFGINNLTLFFIQD